MQNISTRVSGLKRSPIVEIFSRVRALRQEGRDILDLCIGEPDFDTPPHIKRAALDAMNRGETKYTVIDGTAELKDAIRLKFRRDNGLDFEASEITVGSGAKSVIFAALAATLDPGCEVIIPTPAWPSYAEMTTMAGGRPITVRCEAKTGFKLTPELLDAALSPATRWVVLNSPSNPAGVTYSEDELRLLAEVLRRWPDAWIMSDEIYEHIRYTGQPYPSFLAVAPDLRNRVLTVNGVSKAYAMTGWRIGFAAAPAPLVAAMRTVFSHSTSNPCSISQAAAVEALTGDQTFLEARNREFLKRRDYLVGRLRTLPGFQVGAPEGAFYLYLGCEALVGRKLADGSVLDDTFAIARALLDQEDLAVVHGAAFEHDPFIRLSFAASDNELARAADKLESFARSIS